MLRRPSRWTSLLILWSCSPARSWSPSPCSTAFFARRPFSSSPSRLRAAPPRFDVFCERVVGAWRVEGDPTTVVEVEEVMRSCGGAVQGMRETTTTAPADASASAISNLADVYHNRADDGFLYYDDGDYSAGPVARRSDDDELALTTCLRFSDPTSPATTTTTRRSLSRTIVGRNDGSFAVLRHESTNLVRGRGDGDEDEDEDASYSSSSFAVRWTEEYSCTMSSPGSPWMLQRAGWNRVVIDDENEDTLVAVDAESWSSLSDASLSCWAAVSPRGEGGASDGGDDDDDDDATSSSVSARIRSNADDSLVRVQVGACCPRTGAARAVIRDYDRDDGILRAVRMRTGRVVVA